LGDLYLQLWNVCRVQVWVKIGIGTWNSIHIVKICGIIA
jgi:hypothetical protein